MPKVDFCLYIHAFILCFSQKPFKVIHYSVARLVPLFSQATLEVATSLVWPDQVLQAALEMRPLSSM